MINHLIENESISEVCVVKKKLEELIDLYHSDLITNKEYNIQRQKILEEGIPDQNSLIATILSNGYVYLLFSIVGIIIYGYIASIRYGTVQDYLESELFWDFFIPFGLLFFVVFFLKSLWMIRSTKRSH